MPPLPINISLMDVNAFINTHHCLPVKSLFIKESSSDQFHHEGLFSEEIFGQIGSTDRLVTFGYIDLHATIIQPIIYGYLIRLKALYGGIMSGKEYAIFDPKEADFISASADEPNANTGYKFFIDHFNEIKLKRTESVTQNDRVNLIEKYHKFCLIDKYLVLPAGLRDMDITEGKPAADSINKLYSSLINYAAAMPPGAGETDIYDSVRFSIQKKANEIYEFLFDMIDGKFGYFQRKFASRNLALGTRNVITPADMNGPSPDDPSYLKCDEIRLPLFQACKMYQPLVVYAIKNYFNGQVFANYADQVPIINRDTFKLEYVSITEEEKNRFISAEGIDKMISLFRDKEFRFNPVTIEGEDGKSYYMMLMYDMDDSIITFRNIDVLKDTLKRHNLNFKPNLIRPLTYVELMYVAAKVVTDNRYAYVTRYPAIEIGSTVPCRAHLGSTSPARKVNYYSAGYETTDAEGNTVEQFVEFPEYPILGASFVDSAVLHPSILAGLGADFDGNCLTGDTTVVIRYDSNWLNRLAKLEYNISAQNKCEVLDRIKSCTFKQDEYYYAELRLDEFPCPGNFSLDRHGAKVYQIPIGCEALSYDAKLARTSYEPINHITVEEVCDTVQIKLRSKTMSVSTNESLAVFDYQTGGLKRIAPSQCDNNTLIPVVKQRPISLTQNPTDFDYGWLHGAMLSDGWVSDKYIGYAKLEDHIRNKVQTMLIAKLGTEHFREYIESPEFNATKLSNAHKICFGGKEAVSYGQTFNLYGTDKPSALTKQIDLNWLNTKSEDYLYGLLCGLLDGDGSFRFTSSPLRFDVRYSTSSKKLVTGIKRLCYLLGIQISVTTTKPRNWSQEAYTVCLCAGDLLECANKLHFVRPANQLALQTLQAFIATIFRYQRDIIPLTDAEAKALQLAAKKKAKTIYYSNNNRIMRSVAYQLIDELDQQSSLYQRIVNQNIHWEPIRAIIPNGSQTVYDLEIPTTKVFVVNDGVVVYDTVSVNGILSDEANEEVHKHLNSLERYLHANGSLFPKRTDLINLTVFNLSREPVN